MTDDILLKKSQDYLKILCSDIKERCVGSDGNRQATSFFEKELSANGWKTEMPGFEAIDWVENGATLLSGDNHFKVLVAPYSMGFSGEAQLVIASNTDELSAIDARDKIVFLHGEIAKEQLMPKNFVFYNPDEHRRIVSLLENCGAKAIISATGRNSAVAGGVYPFSLIEDGDFDIPSVYMTEEEGIRFLKNAGRIVSLESHSGRIPGKAYNVIGRKGDEKAPRIAITAHIDAKKGIPGAIDNATGVIVLLLLSDLLRDYDGERFIEIVALNGEDYYAVPGQMSYLESNRNNFANFLLNINIDGAGYREGPSSFSLFDLPDAILQHTKRVIEGYEGITEGIQWVQGDHSIFLQCGVPAIAVSSKWLIDNMTDQDITHTPKDNPGIVDCSKVVEIAGALNTLVRSI